MQELTNVGTRRSDQRTAEPGLVKNNAGGYVYGVDAWQRLTRFLVLGTSGGTFYVKERDHTLDNAEALRQLVKTDGVRFVRTVREVSVTGRAPKNDYALFALALAASADDGHTRRLAFDALPDVARTATHLFHFAAFVQQFRGWGRGLRRAVARWYEAKDDATLAYQLVKYRQRDGWTHRDLLRLSHPVILADDPAAKGRRAALYDFACGRDTPVQDFLPPVVKDYKAMAGLAPGWPAAPLGQERVLDIVRRGDVPWEAVPSDLRTPEVWAALVDADALPLGALLRQLPTLTRLDVLGPLLDLKAGPRTAKVLARLQDVDELKRARVHPFQLLFALKTYSSGRSFRGSATWTPLSEVTNALDAAFYASFGAVEPTGKRLLLALDVSGSMGSPILDSNLTAREASAALALVTAASEPVAPLIVGFTSGRRDQRWGYGGYRSTAGTSASEALTPLNLSPRQRLDDAVRAVSGLSFGGTDCALPALYALEKNLYVDTFVVLTDNETWAGSVKPAEALRRYRAKVNPKARMVCVAMTATEYSVADPSDPLSLDVVGFDAATPNVISGFARGAL